MKTKTVNPTHLKLVFEFDANWDHEPTGLFADGQRRLFLADSCGDGETIRRPIGPAVPLEQSADFDFREVTLKEALEWYVRCEPWSNSSIGNVKLLCEMAVKRLR